MNCFFVFFKKIGFELALQFAVLLLCGIEILGKFAGQNLPETTEDMTVVDYLIASAKNMKLVMLVFSIFALLFLYAFIWQQLIKGKPLFVVYANKAMTILWSQMFAVLVFKETLHLNNIIGMIVILIGVFIINQPRKDKEK